MRLNFLSQYTFEWAHYIKCNNKSQGQGVYHFGLHGRRVHQFKNGRVTQLFLDGHSNKTIVFKTSSLYEHRTFNRFPFSSVSNISHASQKVSLFARSKFVGTVKWAKLMSRGKSFWSSSSAYWMRNLSTMPTSLTKNFMAQHRYLTYGKRTWTQR